MKVLKAILLITLISLLITILANNEGIKTWFSKEMRTAVILNLKVKYMIRPEGLET